MPSLQQLGRTLADQAFLAAVAALADLELLLERRMPLDRAGAAAGARQQTPASSRAEVAPRRGLAGAGDLHHLRERGDGLPAQQILDALPALVRDQAVARRRAAGRCRVMCGLLLSLHPKCQVPIMIHD